MSDASLIEISKSAIKNNIRFIQQYVGEKVKISSVVKSNAYGHGFETFVPIVKEAGIHHFSVFSSSEAKKIEPLLTNEDSIMIMGYVVEEDYEWVIDHNIELFVYEPQHLRIILETAKKLKKKARIHLEIETGMNRTGLKRPALQYVIRLIKENMSYFQVQGVCTHYAGAESIANYYRIQKQIKLFNKSYEYIRNQGLNPGLKHTACSAAAVVFPKTQMDMVRIGIMQYGFWPSKETLIFYFNRKKTNIDPLQRVISWKSHIMSIKHVNRGEFVSYGTIALAQNDKKIAIIPVGYASGFSRVLSNNGKVLINGQRVNVIGMVNMNMVIADITRLKNVKIGDEVILIGTQKNLTISVSSFGELSSLLNYELLTRLPLDIKRIIVN